MSGPRIIGSEPPERRRLESLPADAEALLPYTREAGELASAARARALPERPLPAAGAPGTGYFDPLLVAACAVGLAAIAVALAIAALIAADGTPDAAGKVTPLLVSGEAGFDTIDCRSDAVTLMVPDGGIEDAIVATIEGPIGTLTVPMTGVEGGYRGDLTVRKGDMNIVDSDPERVLRLRPGDVVVVRVDGMAPRAVRVVTSSDGDGGEGCG